MRHGMLLAIPVFVTQDYASGQIDLPDTAVCILGMARTLGTVASDMANELKREFGSFDVFGVVDTVDATNQDTVKGQLGQNVSLNGALNYLKPKVWKESVNSSETCSGYIRNLPQEYKFAECIQHVHRYEQKHANGHKRKYTQIFRIRPDVSIHFGIFFSGETLMNHTVFHDSEHGDAVFMYPRAAATDYVRCLDEMRGDACLPRVLDIRGLNATRIMSTPWRMQDLTYRSGYFNDKVTLAHGIISQCAQYKNQGLSSKAIDVKIVRTTAGAAVIKLKGDLRTLRDKYDMNSSEFKDVAKELLKAYYTKVYVYTDGQLNKSLWGKMLTDMCWYVALCCPVEVCHRTTACGLDEIHCRSPRGCIDEDYCRQES